MHTYGFDANGKVKSVDSTTAYTYDGEGHRVRKLVGENTRFIYGIGGQLIMEFDGSTGNLKKEYVYGNATLATIEPTSVNANGTRYTTGDNLGSPRIPNATLLPSQASVKIAERPGRERTIGLPKFWPSNPCEVCSEE